MPYPTYPDLAIPYEFDGTVVKVLHTQNGIIKTFSDSEKLELNDEDYTPTGDLGGSMPSNYIWLVFFFPEKRNITGLYALAQRNTELASLAPTDFLWSPNSTNGLDGDWYNATMPNGFNSANYDFDTWRKSVKPVSSVSGAIAVKIRFYENLQSIRYFRVVHLFGHKTTGETPDDIAFLDPTAGDAEFTLPIDFGDVPAGTSSIRQMKLKNTSSTKTASNIVLSVLDPTDIIRVSLSSGGPWYTSLTFTSLGPGEKTAVIYVKCETPAPPTPLGPDRAPMKVTVGSWT